MNSFIRVNIRTIVGGYNRLVIIESREGEEVGTIIILFTGDFKSQVAIFLNEINININKIKLKRNKC